ncbi:MAG: hypothetical protein RL732_105 [Bacteroidota bacterium]|jgi:hypothetical protein
MGKALRWFLLVLLVAAALFIYIRYYFVFGEGVKAGELNFFVRKGYLWKTYEGRLIQTGYSSQVPGSIQSNEFDFSVEDKQVAEALNASSGRELELHYREYLAVLPWRGMSRYIVDSVVAVREKQGQRQAPY